MDIRFFGWHRRVWKLPRRGGSKNTGFRLCICLAGRSDNLDSLSEYSDILSGCRDYLSGYPVSLSGSVECPSCGPESLPTIWLI